MTKETYLSRTGFYEFLDSINSETEILITELTSMNMDTQLIALYILLEKKLLNRLADYFDEYSEIME